MGAAAMIHSDRDEAAAFHESSVKVNYPDLDTAKLLMALLVVEIHTRPLEALDILERVIEGIDVVAVPFFFIASAFLCFRGLSEVDFSDSSSCASIRVRKTTFKLLELYLIWTVLYLPITIFGDLLYGKDLMHGLLAFVRQTLFVGENFCSWPLWYLLAGFVAFALVYCCLRSGMALKRVVGLSFLFLLAGYFIMVVAEWSDAPRAIAIPVGIYEKLFVNTRNGLFEGFFYVALGAFFGTKHAHFEATPVVCLLIGLIFGVVGCIFINANAHLPFCACAGACLFLLSIKRCGSNLLPHVGMRNASTIIYLVHMMFAVVFVYGICGGVDPDIHANNADRLLLYLFSLGGSALLSAVVIQLSRKSPLTKRIFGI